jgi:hypothetical protein
MLKDKSSTDAIETQLAAFSADTFNDEVLDALATLIGDYVAEARGMSLAGCPSDFRDAYYRYLSGWAAGGDLIRSHPHIPTDDEAKLQILLKTLRDGDADQALFDFKNGVCQVSYDTVAAIEQSRRGDTVRMCLMSIERNCPKGTDPIREYRTTNLRLQKTWTLGDNSHSCRGA